MRKLLPLFLILASCNQNEGPATGSYLGEGLDDARLDTLFLAMPVSWKGTLQQYVAMSGMLTASSDFTFFGSDAAEVTRSRHDWEYLMQKDWQLFETTKFGEPRNLAIQISDDRKLASAVYEVQDVSLIEGRTVESTDRFAITMRKENGDSRIVQGMTAVVTVGESSAEIVARRKSRCRKTEPNHVFSYIWNETES